MQYTQCKCTHYVYNVYTVLYSVLYNAMYIALYDVYKAQLYSAYQYNNTMHKTKDYK